MRSLSSCADQPDVMHTVSSAYALNQPSPDTLTSCGKYWSGILATCGRADLRLMPTGASNWSAADATDTATEGKQHRPLRLRPHCSHTCNA